MLSIMAPTYSGGLEGGASKAPKSISMHHSSTICGTRILHINP
jgi:hypothetical protein